MYRCTIITKSLSMLIYLTFWSDTLVIDKYHQNTLIRLFFSPHVCVNIHIWDKDTVLIRFGLSWQVLVVTSVCYAIIYLQMQTMFVRTASIPSFAPSLTIVSGLTKSTHPITWQRVIQSAAICLLSKFLQCFSIFYFLFSFSWFFLLFYSHSTQLFIMLPASYDKQRSARNVNFALRGVYQPRPDDDKALKLVSIAVPSLSIVFWADILFPSFSIISNEFGIVCCSEFVFDSDAPTSFYVCILSNSASKNAPM